MTEQGIFCGGIPPFGYKSQDGKLVPDPETADVAKSVFETFIRLKSPLATAREMNERGLRLRGNRWQSHNVHRILLNPRYAGDVRIGDKVVRGQHEPLVTRETFESAKAILESLKKPRQQRTGEPTNALLEKLIFCGECNCAMSYRWTLRRHGDRRKEYGYYVCRHTFTYGTSSCQVKTVPAAVVETEVERAVERIFRSSLEFVAVAARKAEIPQTMILGGIRADGVLAVVADDSLKFFFGVEVDNVVSAFRFFPVHSHIERTFHTIGEASLCFIKLKGAHTKVQHNAINQINSQTVKH